MLSAIWASVCETPLGLNNAGFAHRSATFSGRAKLRKEVFSPAQQTRNSDLLQLLQARYRPNFGHR
jgi:hypothetical protein